MTLAGGSATHLSQPSGPVCRYSPTMLQVCASVGTLASQFAEIAVRKFRPAKPTWQPFSQCLGRPIAQMPEHPQQVGHPSVDSTQENDTNTGRHAGLQRAPD